MEDVVLLEGDLLVGKDPLLPFGVVVGGHALVEELQHPAGVPDDVVIGLDVLVDLGAVDVDVDDLGVPGEGGGVQGHPVGETAADGNEQIALIHGEIGGVRAVHPDHAGEQPVAAGTGAAAHDSGGHRGVQRLEKLPEFRYGALGADHAAAHQHQGLLGGRDHIQQLLDVAVVGLGGLEVVGGAAEHGGQAAVCGVLLHGKGAVIHLFIGDVFQDIDEHRARAAGPGDGKGLPDDVGQVLGPAHQVVALGDGHSDPGDVHLLKGVLTDEIFPHIDGDEDHGGGVHIGGGDTGGKVGGPGAGGGEADAHLAGGTGVAVGRVGRPLLMGGENVADLLLVTTALKLVVDVQNGAAGIAENGVDSLLQQALHEHLRAFHLHVRDLLW